MKRFHAEGRLCIAPGMWVVPDLNLPDGESFLQQVRIGKAWIAEHLGGEPEVCWIADCWGHPAQMPQLARIAGYRGYVFWRCMRPEVQCADFVWSGLDGSDVLSHWLARGYANLRFSTNAEAVNAAELSFHNTSAGSIEELVAELDTYGGAGGDQLICNGGDMAFPQASAPAVVARLAEHGFPFRLRFSSLAAFLATRDPAALPVIQGEFNSAFTGTFTSNIRLKLRNRECTERLLALEKLGALRGIHFDADSLWKRLLKQQFHDTICGTIADGALEDALQEFTDLERDLAAAEAELGGLSGPGMPVAYFNPSSFPRVAWCESADHPATVLEFPAHGCAAISSARRLEAREGGPLPTEFSTPFYRVRLDANGYVTSLVEAHTGAECVRSVPGPFGALALTIDHGDLWLNHEGPLNGGSFQASLTQNRPDPLARNEPGGVVVSGPFWPVIEEVRVIAQGPEALVFEQRGRIGFWQLAVEFTSRVRLCAALPWIEYHTRFTPRGRDFRLRAVFGTPFEGGECRHEVPFGVVARGCGEHAAQHFVDLRGPEAGLAVINRGTGGHAVEEGAILMSVFRAVAMDYKAPSTLSYAEGIPHAVSYAVMPHAGPATAELVRAGAAFNQPILPVAVPFPGGGFVPEEAHILVTSVRAAKEGTAVRLAEMAGEAGHVRLRLPGKMTRWAEADGLGRRTGDWQPVPERAAWEGEAAPWQIITLLFA